MEFTSPNHSRQYASTNASNSSPRFTPIAIAPRPSSSTDPADRPTSFPTSQQPTKSSSTTTASSIASRFHSTSPQTSSSSSFTSTNPPVRSDGAYSSNSSNSSNTSPPAALRTPAPVPTREYWSEADKYDLLWSIILSSGITLSTIRWDKLRIPGGRTQHSAAVIVQDIALGKHHIMHPTFTPSNSNNNKNNNNSHDSNNYSSSKSSAGGTTSSNGKIKEKKSKKRKLADDADDRGEQSRPSSGMNKTNTSGNSSTLSLSTGEREQEKPSIPTGAAATSTPLPPDYRRRRPKSESPPIELDLTNPRICQFLKQEGYMNDDGTPVKKKRGRPTKDPFGLSVTLKKQLLKLDPNAPPLKKRGRPRKDLEGESVGTGGEKTEPEGETTRQIKKAARQSKSNSSYSGGKPTEGSISPSLRTAIEKIGEEMDRDLEDMLDEGRQVRDDLSEESESYGGSVAELWETYESDEEEARRNGRVRMPNGGEGSKNRRESYMMVDQEYSRDARQDSGRMMVDAIAGAS
ncbi:hypothetical protein ABW20_dc0109308 [Dactylellina cionopaga]|nr:hypothetical protein ABW20_dc0109308 [Dactylellina cionopaga]